MEINIDECTMRLERVSKNAIAAEDIPGEWEHVSVAASKFPVMSNYIGVNFNRPKYIKFNGDLFAAELVSVNMIYKNGLFALIPTNIDADCTFDENIVVPANRFTSAANVKTNQLGYAMSNLVNDKFVKYNGRLFKMRHVSEPITLLAENGCEYTIEIADNVHDCPFELQQGIYIDSLYTHTTQFIKIGEECYSVLHVKHFSTARNILQPILDIMLTILKIFCAFLGAVYALRAARRE